MITSTTKMIAALAVSAGLLTTNAAFAGHSGHSGGGNSGGNNAGNNFTAFKVNSNPVKLNSHINTINSNSISSISKKPFTVSQSFKKQDFSKDQIKTNLHLSDNKKDNLHVS